MRRASRATLPVATAIFTLLLGTQTAAAEVALVPLILYEPTPGINGARWKTDFTMENYGDVSWGGIFAAGCTLDGVEVRPHTTIKNPFCVPGDEGALVDIADDQLIRFQLRVRDVTAGTSNYGTEIPVIRASETFRGPSAILDVPTSPDLRRTIRLYSLSRTEAFRFRLKIKPLLSNDVVFEFAGELPPAPYTIVPSALRLRDGIELPDLRAVGDVKIEIIPDSGDVPYWWFLSLASNSTNALTVVSPQ